MRLWWIAVLGCNPTGTLGVPGEDGAADADADTDTDADTDADADPTSSTTATTTTTATGTAVAACVNDADNALRVICTVTVDPPQPVEIRFAPTAGGADRVALSDTPHATHTVTVWRMVELTDYTFTATGLDTGAHASGGWTTPRVPDAFRVDPQLSAGVPTTMTDDLLFQMGCGEPFAAAIDTAGKLVWYQPLARGLPGGNHSVQGISFSPDREVVAILDNEHVRRFGLDGSLRMDARGGTGGLRPPLHHDVFSRDGYTWVLAADSYRYNGVDYVIDSVFALDPTGVVLAEFRLVDLITPDGSGGPGGFGGYWAMEFPGDTDWSHGNGIYVTEAYELLVSFYELDGILAVGGDPTAADFGQLRWTLETSTSSPLVSDYAVTDPAGLTADETFGNQHHPSLQPDGSLLMFDNGGGFANARGLQLGLDLAAGTAEIVGSWPLPESCAFEGGAYFADNGDVILTCAPTRQIYQLDAATGQILQAYNPECEQSAGFGGPFLARGIPVAL